jgi:hypothetical protein
MLKYNFLQELENDEECKELKDYPEYFITTKGRVWSSIKGKGRWLSQYKQGQYYWGTMVGGRSGGNKLIHQLVGRNFLKEYKSGMYILHKNETLNYPNINFLDNLYVGTQKDNIIDKNIKNRGRHNGKSHLTTQQVEEIRLIWYNTQGQTTNEFSTKICELYGVSRSAISCIIREKTWNYV